MVDKLLIIGALVHIMRLVLIILEITRPRRRWWVRPTNRSRNKFGFHETCMKKILLNDQDDLFKAARMDEHKFNLLLSLLKEKLSRRSQREPIQPEMRLAVTLMYLAHGCSFQVLVWAFKLGVSTVRAIIYDTCDAIWSELHPIYLAQPTVPEWAQIAQQFFDKTGMPHCLVAVDGKLINIACPRRSGSLYYSYKKTFSIILLAACDMNLTFTLVDVGAVGSQSDGGVFVRSGFGKAILQNTLPVPESRNLPGSAVCFPYYFVGDNAFPLRVNVMRPYPGRNLLPDKSHFNKTLSTARVRIEMAFGILANRWRILQTKIHAEPKNVDKIVLATIVLHNFLMLQKTSNYYSADDMDTFEATPLNRITTFSNRSSQRAFIYRDVLKDYLNRNSTNEEIHQ